MKIKREERRVCYIQSNPEWFSYGVLRLFYRNPFWVFVPLQGLSINELQEEYQKATYFFVSGYGNSKIAEEAYRKGCILIGVRADVSSEIEILESKQWDPFSVYASIRFYSTVYSLPLFFKFPVRFALVFLSHIWWYFQLVLQMFKHDNVKTMFIKIKKFFKIS
ncbi:MAG: hypothetical protein KGL67_00055 [Patescibacteria group bacterium]|nr:hypothetical protein [Patescibacteria group bacterium]